MEKYKVLAIVGFSLVSIGLLMGEVKNLFDIIQSIIIIGGINLFIYSIIKIA